MINDKILLVGCGKMGSALLDGLINSGANAANIMVIEPHTENISQKDINIISNIDNGLGSFKTDTVLLAVKPQMMEQILPQIAAICPENTLFLSIAAGKTVAFYEKYLGKNAKIVRAMPNLPAIVGKGVTVLTANNNIDNDCKKRTAELFEAVGSIFWLEDESLMDAVTAISGSGPAYVFYFMESLLNAAKELGLPEELGKMLTYSTFSGSATLAEESDKSVKTLKEQVISPKGTTEAGLNILAKDNALEKLVLDTAKAACNRSRELA